MLKRPTLSFRTSTNSTSKSRFDVRLDVEQHVQLLLACADQFHRLHQSFVLHLFEDLVQLDGWYVRLVASVLCPDAFVAGIAQAFEFEPIRDNQLVVH